MTTTAITISTDGDGCKPQAPSRIYVGIDVGYKVHVVAAIPMSWFNRHTDIRKGIAGSGLRPCLSPATLPVSASSSTTWTVSPRTTVTS